MFVTPVLSKVPLLTTYSMSPTQNLLDRQLGAATEKLSLMSHEAAHAVFSTNELLCDIVARLPFKDILSATRTCKAWRNALKADHHVQEALFLKPMEVREVRCDNHLLNDIERPISLEHCTIIGKLHPYLHHLCDEVEVELQACGVWCLGPFPKSDHPNGSWREMFIAQPPLKNVKIAIHISIESEELRREYSAGMKLGDVYDLIHSHFRTRQDNLDGEILIRGYADEDLITWEDPINTRCKVHNGEVCRPTDLPLRVTYSDTDDEPLDYSEHRLQQMLDLHGGGMDLGDSNEDDGVYSERMQMLDDLQEDIIWTGGIDYHPANDYGPDYED